MCRELQVSELMGPDVPVECERDTWLSSQSRSVEQELRDVTRQLEAEQGRIAALFEMARRLRGHLTVDSVLAGLAQAAVELSDAVSAFAFVVTQDGLKIAQHPTFYADNRTLVNLFADAIAQESAPAQPTTMVTAVLPQGAMNLLIVPMEIRDVALAGLGLIAPQPTTFDISTAKLMWTIAQASSAQIEGIFHYQESITQIRGESEMEVAARIQMQLLPRTYPKVHGLDVFAHSFPAQQVGGDFFNFTYESGRDFMFTIGDVAGKGVSAALLMSMTHTTIRNSARFMPTPTPRSVLYRANQDLYDSFTNVGLFATAFIGQYDAARQTLHYANAGHSPVLFCPSGGRARLLEADGFPIGVLPDMLSENQTVGFRRGDLLIAATDGFAEASDRNDEMFGYDRLLQLAEQLADRSAQEIGQAFFATIGAFSIDRMHDDDRTIVVLKGEDA